MFKQVIRNLRRWISGTITKFKFGSLQEFVSVILGFFVLAIAVHSIEQARWIKHQPSLIFVLLLATLAALLLAKSRLSNRIIYSLATIIGLVVVFWQSTGLITAPEGKSTLHYWWYTVSALQFNEGTFYFGVFLIVVTGLIGFVSTWFILRKRNVWVTVTMGTLMILINLSNLPPNYYYIFPIYLVAALLLIGQAYLARQDVIFKKWQIRYPHRGIAYFFTAVFCISVLIVCTAWFVPEPPIDRIRLMAGIGGIHVTGIEESWFNILADIKSKWRSIESTDQETLFFQDQAKGSSKIVFVITSNQTGYWRTRRYDTYHSWGWTSNTTSDRRLNPGEMRNDGEVPGDGDELIYTVENKLKTDVVLTGGELQSINIPVLLKTLSADETEEEPSTTSTQKLITTEDNRTDSGESIITVVSELMLKPGQRYTAVSHLNSITPEELSQAGEEYDQQVTGYYLQLPDSLPERVRMASINSTQGKQSPYEKVIAIKEFLNDFEYDLETEPPGEGVDGVDCFLFSNRKGTCINFASAMVVMLRSVGVPARLCTGYLKGELDKDTGNIIIRSRNKHAWVEVYFEGHGWVEFEATPSSESEDEEAGVVGVGNTFYYIEELFHFNATEEPVQSGYIESSGTIEAKRSGLKFYQYGTIIGILVFLFIIVRLAINRWIDRLQTVGNPFDAYNRMCFLASLGKAGKKVQETPIEFSARLALVLPAQTEAINNITQAYMDTRYSPRKELQELETVRLQTSWVRLSYFLLKSVFRLRRS